MPLYDYKCPVCDLTVEVRHSMDEVNNPSEETAKQITCNEHTCPRLKALDNEALPEYGTTFKKVISAPAHNRFGSMTQAEKKGVLQKRSNKHFRKDIHERKMFMDGKSKKQF